MRLLNRGVGARVMRVIFAHPPTYMYGKNLLEWNLRRAWCSREMHGASAPDQRGSLRGYAQDLYTVQTGANESNGISDSRRQQKMRAASRSAVVLTGSVVAPRSRCLC